MKKILLSIFLILTVAFPLNAQLNDWGTKIGIRGNILFPENEFANLGFGGLNDFSFDWYKFSYLAEAYLGIKASRILELQLTLGYGKYSGKAYFEDPEVSYDDYRSTIIPVDLRFKICPWELEKWNPYFYLGGGLMSYDLSINPSDELGGESTEDAGWTGIFPIGLGTELVLSNNFLLDFSLGWGFSTTFDLDDYNGGEENIRDFYFNTGIGLSMISESCMSDRDNDDIVRCDEVKFGTNPENPDTDVDGLKDGDEIFIYQTNPLDVDTDFDGLNDYDEVLTYSTNPLMSDTDNDNLSDSEEVLSIKTDPLKIDTDEDDLTDGDEVLIHKSNPLRADTDGDGLSDGGEVLDYKTNPLNPDTDGEGLSDSEEVLNYKTDPNDKDTDDGTIDDFTEINNGTDPLDPSDDIIQIDVPIVLTGITFETGKDEITPESEIVLQGALKTLQNYPDIIIEISGHTDDVGSESNNIRLSQKRADAVRNWLITQGIEPDRIIAKGYGEASPRIPNDSPTNRRLNRRIEFKRIK